MLCSTPDGTLGHREISQLLMGIGIRVSAQELKDLISDVVGEESKIDFNGFVILMTRKYKQLSFDEEISDLFDSLDLNKNQILDANDLVNLLSDRGINISQGEAQGFLSMFSDSNQGMCIEELKSFIQTKM